MVCMPDTDRATNTITIIDFTDQFDDTEVTLLLCTCPEGQAQNCLVHGVFEAEVWDDLEVVGGMQCVGCKYQCQNDRYTQMKTRFSQSWLALQVSYRM